MNVGIIGLGLIGGSFALTARKYIKGSIIYGEDNNKSCLLYSSPSPRD